MNIDAYKDGLDAAYRTGPYEGVKDVPKCPFAKDTKEYEEWWQGFGDGTEDFICSQRLD
jgi:hypothetical protein